MTLKIPKYSFSIAFVICIAQLASRGFYFLKIFLGLLPPNTLKFPKYNFSIAFVVCIAQLASRGFYFLKIFLGLLP